MRTLIEYLNGQFEYFKLKYWIYDAQELCKVYDNLSSQDKLDFLCDPRKLDIVNEGKKLYYGI